MAVVFVEQAKRHQRVKKVVCRAFVQAEPVPQGAEGQRAVAQMGEDFQFDGAQHGS